MAWSTVSIQGDGFWYVVAGRWVLETGRLPERDPFSYTAMKDAWVLHMPLCQVVMAWLDARWGPASLVILGTLLAWLACMLLWLPHGRSRFARVAALGLVVLWAWLERDTLSVRGQLVGDVGFAVLLWGLERGRRGRAVPAWAMVLLGSVWASSHPSFLLVVALPALWAAAMVVDPGFHPRAWKPLISMAAWGLLGTGLSPYSFRAIPEAMALAANPTTPRVNLFRSPDFHDPGWLVLALVTVACAALLLRGRRPRRRSLALLLLVALLAVAWSQRYAFLPVGLGVVAMAEVAGPWLNRWARRRAGLVVTAAAGVAALLLGGRLALTPRDAMDHAPVAAASAVDELHLPDNVLGFYGWGGYLLYRWAGQRPIFIDGRNNLYANGVVMDYMRVQAVAEGWEEVLDMYDLNTVLWLSQTPLDQALSRDPRWRQVYRDDSSVVFTRALSSVAP
jgi:MFS family permease